MDRVLLVLCVVLSACGQRAPSANNTEDSGVDSQEGAPTEAPAVEVPVEVPEAESAVVEEVEVRIEDGLAYVPAGTVIAGSEPGTVGRDARAEADLVPVELGAFWIEVEPRETRNMTFDQAANACEADGLRLCGELEWERACEGPESHLFAGGETYDPSAISAFGVRALGTGGEWTAGEPVRDVAGSVDHGAVFRGARADAEAPMHRCSARRGTASSTQSRHLGFRCCRSESPYEASYPDEAVVGRFRAIEDDVERLRAVLRSVPELAAFADAFRPQTLDEARASIGASAPEGFEEMDEESAAAALRTPGELFGWEIAPAALRWSPTPGEVLWVLSGFVRERPALFAVYALADGSFRHATSAILEPGARAIAVAYTPSERGFLKWSARWGTSAEGGVLALREDRTVRLEVR